jgi:hypothetical protein
MDDIAIATSLNDKDKHITMMHDLFHILAAHGLHLKLSKSMFLQPQMDFLGVCINKDRVAIDSAKLAGLCEYLRMLHILKQAHRFLGCAGYSCMFCKNFSTIAKPITRLTQKNEPFIWGPEQQATQEEIIQRITNSPILACPDPS